MTIVNKMHPTDLDRIHIQRMDHAFRQLILELSDMRNETVNYILRRWSITPFEKSVGIEYPYTAKQILERELQNTKKTKKQIKKK